MLTYQNYHRHSHLTNVRIADSAVTNAAYARRAVELGHGILSSCEHGWQGQYNDVIRLAKEYGLKPLVSAEAYWVKDREEKDRTNCHIFIGAMNENGRRALNDVLSEANLTGFYGQPRLDIPLLLSLPKDDVVVTTACVAYWRYEDIEEITTQLHNYFGKNFFLEVQYHNTPSQIELNQRILRLRNKLGAQIIMGCDSHYIYPEQAQARTDFLASKGLEYPEEDGWFLDYPDGDTAYQRFAYVCTASGFDTIKSKFEAILRRHFPFITRQNIIVAQNKQLINGDILIDEGVHNLEGGAYRKILMSAPHNKCYDAESNGMTRVNTWAEAYNAVHAYASDIIAKEGHKNESN